MPDRSPDSTSIDLANGRVLDIAIQPEAAGKPIEVTVIEEIQGRLFHSCPICGTSATEDEHVPPASMGGKIMTRTCGPCNHRLGSHVEADLADWYDNALTLPRFASSGVQGDRKSGRILWRTTPAGEFVLLMNGRYDPAITDMLNSGQVDLAGLLPDRNRYHLALLKHTYIPGGVHEVWRTSRRRGRPDPTGPDSGPRRRKPQGCARKPTRPRPYRATPPPTIPPRDSIRRMGRRPRSNRPLPRSSPRRTRLRLLVVATFRRLPAGRAATTAGEASGRWTAGWNGVIHVRFIARPEMAAFILVHRARNLMGQTHHCGLITHDRQDIASATT